MSGSDIVAIISALSACFAIFSVIRNYRQSSQKEIERRTTERTETNVKLDTIGRNVADIKETMNETKKDIQHLNEKLALVDAKAEKAHLRIDMLEKEVSENERKD